MTALVPALEQVAVVWVEGAGLTSAALPLREGSGCQPAAGRAWAHANPPGQHGQRQALEWGVRVAGCTTHLVDEEVDHGPILLQEPVPILEGDDEARLHARIQEVEHRLYPRAVRLWLGGRLEVRGRRVRVLDPVEEGSEPG